MGLTRQSLLIRAQAGDEASWKDLADLYRPFLINWLKRHDLPERDREDLAQEILVSVVRYLPSFQHPGHPGAFRSWLRTIAANRLSDYWRARKPDEPAVTGGSTMTEVLNQFADPDSSINRSWDQEHDRYVLRCVLDLVEKEFERKTFQAFRRLTLDDASGAQVAAELGMSVGAVYVAKSRILQLIREEAAGLID
jgi:RNA polymerase sigma-70 factor (ECF subfamily)